jgi:uncharacterized protein (DUF1778 family)
MINIEPKKSKVRRHINIKQFNQEERELIKLAVQKTETIRPVFYHDAVVEKAKKILEDPQ